ncbi:MAG: polysaccharide biosynthesis protein [Ruminococcus sp.]|nr:polysaccharide biosynthesis protein [Ruminococcus sp.]
MADAFIIVVSALIANFVISAFDRPMGGRYVLSCMAMCGFFCVASMTFCGLYSKMWRYFNFKDYLFCITGAVSGFLISYSVMYLITGVFFIKFTVPHVLISLLGIVLFRLLFKSAFITLSGNATADKGKRTMIVGAGTTCELLLTEIKHAKLLHQKSASARFCPVCIVDDDPAKIGKEFEGGVTVVGTTDDIHRFVEQFSVEQIIFAIPSCPEDKKRKILDICSSTKVSVKVIPYIGELIFNENKPIIGQLRDIRIEDLLGRDPITFDNKDIKNFISGKVCMVTGGGGSIGSELVRQITRFGPKQIIIVDIYENNAYEIQQELRMEYGDKLNLVTLIASVRDYHRMNQIFLKYKPQIIFHAAAHKHVPLMEVSPMEAIKNNVIGTFNVATLAEYHGVEKFVMISTDKAVNPTNVMGASKRCCEMVVQYLSQQPNMKTEYVTTRFGNVLGSNGSVIPLFKKQIERGGPVTVTHPDIIRYFMTIPEAVSLVMEAAAIAHGGEIFVLDMGQPVKIVTLAENLIRMYGKVPGEDIEIVFTGLRPGEKIREELLMMEEGLKSTQNKLIFIGRQIEIDPEEFIAQLETLKEAASKDDEAAAVEALHRIVPAFITPEEFNKKELAK